MSWASKKHNKNKTHQTLAGPRGGWLGVWWRTSLDAVPPKKGMKKLLGTMYMVICGTMYMYKDRSLISCQWWLYVVMSRYCMTFLYFVPRFCWSCFVFLFKGRHCLTCRLQRSGFILQCLLHYGGSVPQATPGDPGWYPDVIAGFHGGERWLPRCRRTHEHKESRKL